MTRVNVLYFARLREAFGRSSEELDLPEDQATVGALIGLLRRRGEVWLRELEGRPFRVAVNQEMVGLDAPLAPGDEVAIFPPVTGG